MQTRQPHTSTADLHRTFYNLLYKWSRKKTKFVSPHITLCGWLGSKHQLTNYCGLSMQKLTISISLCAPCLWGLHCNINLYLHPRQLWLILWIHHHSFGQSKATAKLFLRSRQWPKHPAQCRHTHNDTCNVYITIRVLVNWSFLVFYRLGSAYTRK